MIVCLMVPTIAMKLILILKGPLVFNAIRAIHPLTPILILGGSYFYLGRVSVLLIWK